MTLPPPPPVNNAGIQFVSPVADFPEDKWDDVIAVCLSSAFHTSKAALPYMQAAGWGRIINTGSMHALVASPYKSAYNAAKHGGMCVWGYDQDFIRVLGAKHSKGNSVRGGHYGTTRPSMVGCVSKGTLAAASGPGQPRYQERPC